MGISEARDAAREHRAQIGKGIDPKAVQEPEITVTKALSRYERERLHDCKSGAEIARVLRQGLAAHADSPLAELRRRDLVDVHQGIRDRGKAVLANRTLGYAVTFLNWAVLVDLIPANPAAGLKRGLATRERPRERVLTDAELAAVWHATHDATLPAWYGAMVRVLILTGQRRGEIASLRAAWIDGDGWATVPAEHYKTDRPHRFHLTPRARAQLPAFSGPKYFLDEAPWSRYKRRLDQLSGVRGWTLHDLRRTFATGLLRLGERSEVVEMCLGHVRQGIARVYQLHDYAPETRRAWRRWSAHVLRVLRAHRG